MKDNANIVNALTRGGYLAADFSQSGQYKDRSGFMRRPHVDRHNSLKDTPRSVVRHVTVLGDGGHMSCYDMPVSVPRISILEVSNAAA